MKIKLLLTFMVVAKFIVASEFVNNGQIPVSVHIVEQLRPFTISNKEVNNKIQEQILQKYQSLELAEELDGSFDAQSIQLLVRMNSEILSAVLVVSKRGRMHDQLFSID